MTLPVNPASARSRIVIGYTAFALFSLAMLVIGLDSAFANTDDALFAWGLRDAIRQGRWLDYQWFGAPFQHAYPPLPYLLSSLSARLFGVSEFGIRLVPALCSWGTLLMMLASCRALCKSPWSGIFAALSLLSLTLFLYYGKAAGVDAPLMFCISAAQYFALIALDDPRKWAWCGVFAGLAIMSKGVAAGPPLLGLALVLLVSSDRPKVRVILKTLGIALLVAGPWHLYQSIRFGQEFWQHYIGYNVITRYASTIVGTESPWHFYLSTMLETDTVMTVLLCTATLFAIAVWTYRRSLRQGIFIGPLVLSLAIFSLSSTHVFKYLLPALPSLCILAALALDRIFTKFSIAPTLLALPLIIFLTHTLPLTSGTSLPPGLQALALRSQVHLDANQPLYVFDSYHAAAAYYCDRPTILVTTDKHNYDILMAVPGLRLSKTIVFVPKKEMPAFLKTLVKPTLLIASRLQPEILAALKQASLSMDGVSEGEYLLLWAL